MSLIDVYKTPCVMMIKTPLSDGIGGFAHEWDEGEPFEAAIVKSDTIQITPGEKSGIETRYMITVSKDKRLKYHDVFKRVEDGAIFRVIVPTIDSQTPSVATFHIGQAEAERWELA